MVLFEYEDSHLICLITTSAEIHVKVNILCLSLCSQKNNLVDSVFFVMTGDVIGKMSRCLLRQETVLCCFVMLENVILIVHFYVSTDIIAKILCSLFPQVM